MSCKVSVPLNVKEKIADWRLPESVVIEIYTRFRDELAKRPLEVIRRVYDPTTMYQYSFPVKHESTKYTFVFEIGVQDDGENLLVQNAWKLCFVKRMTGKSLPVSTSTTTTAAP